MDGYQFHAELPKGRNSKSACKKYGAWTRATIKKGVARGMLGTCVAVLREGGNFLHMGFGNVECVAAVYDRPNSPVASTSCDRDWLRKRTVRIDEATARKLHPEMFRYLDA